MCAGESETSSSSARSRSSAAPTSQAHFKVGVSRIPDRLAVRILYSYCIYSLSPHDAHLDTACNAGCRPRYDLDG